MACFLIYPKTQNNNPAQQGLNWWTSIAEAGVPWFCRGVSIE